MLRRYVLPIFDPASSVAVVACAPGKADDIIGGLSSEGFSVEKRELKVDPDELGDGGSESGSGTGSSD